jgi:hypothetical protein
LKRKPAHASQYSSIHVAAVGLALALSQGGCSSDGSASGDVSPAGRYSRVEAAMGTVSVTYSLPGSTKVTSLSYWITGPSGAVNVLTSATLSVKSSNSGSFNIGNVLAGNWAIVLTAAPGGGVTCSGTGSFTVSGNGTTPVMIAMQCSASDAGSGWAAIGSNPYVCGTANFVSAVPAETTVGNSVLLTGGGTAPDPTAITYAWSAPSGSFDTPNAASTHFKCTTAGPVTVTFTVGDGAPADAGACDPAVSTRTAQILCD